MRTLQAPEMRIRYEHPASTRDAHPIRIRDARPTDSIRTQRIGAACMLSYALLGGRLPPISLGRFAMVTYEGLFYFCLVVIAVADLTMQFRK